MNPQIHAILRLVVQIRYVVKVFALVFLNIMEIPIEVVGQNVF